MEQAMDHIDLGLYQPFEAENQPKHKISKNMNLKADLTDCQAMSLMRCSKGYGNSRVVITGPVMEFDLYENPVPLPGNKPTAKTGHFMSDKKCCGINDFDTEKEQRRKTGHSFSHSSNRDYIQDGFSKKDRTYHTKNRKREARWLINTNFSNGKAIFVTLTYSKPVFDYSIARKHIKNFLGKLKKNISKDIRYIGVPEKHGSDAWHFHIIIDRKLPIKADQEQKYKKSGTLQSMWPHGNVDVNQLNGGGNIGASLGKYITKMSSMVEMKHRHYFFRSDNLLKPTILTGDAAREFMVTSKEQGYYLTWSSSYVTDTYVGTIRSYHYRKPAKISSMAGKKIKLKHTVA